jgi:RNA polymerase sigma-70 factor (ECF subfamily)
VPHTPEAHIEHLHDRHAGTVRRVCASILRDPEEAADAAQETWIRVLVALRSGQPPIEHPAGWLATIARNCALDRRRRAVMSAAAELASLPDPEPGPAERVHLRQRAGALLEDLAVLSDDERRALLLRAGGLPYREIGRRLGVPADGAAQLLRRGHAVLAARRDGREAACSDVAPLLESRRLTPSVRAHADVCSPCGRRLAEVRARRVLA